jgi:hypothetical protein
MKNHNKLTNDYDMIMNGYQNNPIFNQTWNKKGDYYEQYSIYDDNEVTVSGILK